MVIFLIFLVTGAPIIRPLWWLHTTDPTSQTIDDEFLIGDTLLVAPILKPNMVLRDIYIPHGQWKDNINGAVIDGPVWLRDFHIALDKIATFTFVKM